MTESKKIEPQDPSALPASDTSTDKPAVRKTASANARFRKAATLRIGRKTNRFSGG